MGPRFRVSVERIDDVDGAQYETRESLLFEATSPEPTRLAAYAADEVRAALLGAAGVAEGPHPQVAAAAEYFAQYGARAAAAEAQAERVDEPAPDKPRRTRRTKAQIEADRAAEQAAAAGEHGNAVADGVAGDPAPVAVVTLPAGTSETGERLTVAPEDAPSVSAPAPAEVPAAPYNPFL